jgi:DNA-directed RNA polymerase specialized sigma24 family protein
MPLFRAPQDAISNSLEISFVERAIRREREAFAALHDCHLDRIYSYISFSLKNAPEAEDLTQEVFIRAWKNIHKYRVTGAPFITWLIAIARNMVADHFRARKKINTTPPGGRVLFRRCRGRSTERRHPQRPRAVCPLLRTTSVSSTWFGRTIPMTRLASSFSGLPTLASQ